MNRKEVLKTIPINAFDEDGWLKPPILIYLNLVILAKGLLLFIASLASFSSGDAILELFFPEKAALYLAIALSVIPIFTLAILTLGKLNEYLKIKKGLLMLCVMQIAAELSLLSKSLINEYAPLESTTFQILIAYAVLLGLTFSSKRVKLFLNQFIEGIGLIEDRDKIV